MRISDWSSDVCSSDLREPPLEFLELLDDPCWRLRKHHRAQREYRSDLDRDEAVALRPGSVGRATPIRCGHCLGGEASREWRIILKPLCALARRSILESCPRRRLVGFDDHGRVVLFGPLLDPNATPQ